MTSPQPTKHKGLPNPYAGGLPNPYQLPADGQVPQVVNDDQAKAEQKKTAAHGFHNPHLIKRPQAKGSNIPKKPTMPVIPVNAVDSAPASGSQQKHDFRYYLSTEDDDAEINFAREQRNKENKLRAKEAKRMAKKFGSWFPDRPYNPSRYTNIAAYKGQGGYDLKVNSFHNFLRVSSGRPAHIYDKSSSPPNESQRNSQSAPRSPTGPAFIPNDQTGDEAYARRARLSSTPQAVVPPPPHSPPPPPPPQNAIPPPPPPPPSAPSIPTISAPPLTISAPPVTYSHTISAPPVHYQQAEVRNNVRERPSRARNDEPPAKKPKMSIGARLMAKMGHVEGEGLGKNSDGIITHLEAVKRKNQGRIDDNDDPDRVKSAQVFDIRGGQRTAQPEESLFGPPSRVVVMFGCIDGVDLVADAGRNDGGVRQDMGDVFQAKFGEVKRIHYNADIPSSPVYIEFADGMSALNAVNRFHEGYEFQGRKIRAKFYMEEKFRASIYDY